MKYEKEFEFAKQLIKEVYTTLFTEKFSQVSVKQDASLVTNLDLACEEYVLKRLDKAFPKDHYVSEETNAENEIQNRTWILDPIDGTNNFIKGFQNWAIQLAFVDQGSTQFSIIYQPKLNEFYSCYKGQGVYLNDQRLLPLKPVNRKLWTVEYCGKTYKLLDEYTTLFRPIAEEKITQMYLGSAAGSYANLISSRTCYLISSCKNPWDILPGILMCEEMGIQITKYEKYYTYSNCNEIDIIVKSAIK